MNIMDLWAAPAPAAPTVTTPTTATQRITYGPGNPPGLGAILDPRAYGGIPVLPPSTTDTTSRTSGWTTGLFGYDDLNRKASGVVGDQLGGSVGQDVLNLLQQQAAERGVGFGSNSPISSASYLKATGQTAQGLQQLGVQNLLGLLNASPRTTTETGSTTHDLSALQAILNASPDPYARAMAEWAAQNLGLGVGMHTTSFAPRQGAPTFPIMPSPSRGGGSLPGNPYTSGRGTDMITRAGGGNPGAGASIPGYDEYGNEVSWNPDVYWNGYNMQNPYGGQGIDLSPFDDANQYYDWGTGNELDYPDTTTTYNPVTDTSDYNYGSSGWEDYGGDYEDYYGGY